VIVAMTFIDVPALHWLSTPFIVSLD
jgi:hypothetical protein